MSSVLYNHCNKVIFIDETSVELNSTRQWVMFYHAERNICKIVLLQECIYSDLNCIIKLKIMYNWSQYSFLLDIFI